MKKNIICYDINGEKHDVDVDQLVFRPSVYGILIEDGKILLSKQWDGYDFPGGAIEIDETVDEALEREFWEETGVCVKRGEIVACESSFFITPYTDKKTNGLLVYYLVERVGGELSMDNFDEHEKKYAGMPEWIDLKKIKNIKFYNSVDSISIIGEAKKKMDD